jgi:hypothetical protein
LMAVSSTGQYLFAVFDGAVKGAMYNDFVSRLPPRACLVKDKASIHKRSPGRVVVFSKKILRHWLWQLSP